MELSQEWTKRTKIRDVKAFYRKLNCHRSISSRKPGRWGGAFLQRWKCYIWNRPLNPCDVDEPKQKRAKGCTWSCGSFKPSRSAGWRLCHLYLNWFLSLLVVSQQVYWKEQVLIIEFPCLFSPKSIKSVPNIQNSLTLKQVIYLSIAIYYLWRW